MKIFKKFISFFNKKNTKKIIGKIKIFNDIKRTKVKNFYSNDFKPKLKKFLDKVIFNELNKVSKEKSINQYILINYIEGYLQISEIIESSNFLKVCKTFEINLPNNLVSENKVINKIALSDILKNILTLFDNHVNKPILLNLDSSLFEVKSLSKKDSKRIDILDPVVISESPYTIENTSAIIKDINEQKSVTVFFTNKEIIESWENFLINLNKPLIGISNGFIQLIYKISLSNKVPKDFIVADVGINSCNVFFHSSSGEISSLKLPYGTELYNSRNEDIRIEFLKRFQSSIYQFLSEIGSKTETEIYLGGEGLYVVENDIKELSANMNLINEKLNYKIDFFESKDKTKEKKLKKYRNQIFSLGVEDLKYNAIQDSSLYKKYKFNFENKKNIKNFSKLKSLTKEVKKLTLKNKFYFYPLFSVFFISLIIWITAIPALITRNKLIDEHNNFKSASNKLKINNNLISKKITNLINFSSIYRNHAPVFLFSKFLQESIPTKDTKLVGFLLNNNGFNLELISKNIDSINKVIKLLENNPIINANSLSIEIIRNLNLNNKSNNEIQLKLNGRLNNLSLKERLQYSKKYKNDAAYIKLKPFSNVKDLFE